MTNDVVVGRDNLLYHNPSKLASTWDMDEMTMDEAEEMGLTPCTSCYPELQSDQSVWIKI